ncbi:MAG: folylpolyglutamate synthase/dihydrofolate synthase family protein [Thermoanaerobaculia bacterium]
MQSGTDILKSLEQYGVRLGLETTHRLLAAQGHPERQFPAVLIAGTNGKGSTAAFLASMGTCAGYRTGLYTSPHLEEVEERIRIDGHAISKEELSSSLGHLVTVAERALGHLPTYFEALTAVAFSHFAAQEVDLAILEVGMGGRLDATNATEPVLSLITEIGLEHRQHLGENLDSIAREKAGILRTGKPAVAWVERPESKRAIQEVAAAVEADLRLGPETTRLEIVEDRGWDGQQVHLQTAEDRYRLSLLLGGHHQANNAALAVLGAEILAQRGWGRLSRDAIVAGAAGSRWPGRLERVDLPGGRSVLLDVAHNPDGAAALARFLSRRELTYDLLFGVLADKDVGEILPVLAEGARRVILTSPDSHRALPPEEIERLVPTDRVVVESAAAPALDRALAGDDELLVVCGSIYLVGEVRGLLRHRFGAPPPAVSDLGVSHQRAS